jgi:hypothetical protein
MTVMSYRLILNDSELITLRSALSHYSNFCKDQLAKGERAPFFAHQITITELQSKVLDSITRGQESHERWKRKIEKILAPLRAKQSKARGRRAGTQSAPKHGGRKKK